MHPFAVKENEFDFRVRNENKTLLIHFLVETIYFLYELKKRKDIYGCMHAESHNPW